MIGWRHFRGMSQEISEHLIPMPSHITKTVAEFREFYTRTSPTSWPDITFHANLKPWSYEEYQDFRNKLHDFFKELGYEVEEYSIICNEPPRQEYPLMLSTFKQGGDFFEAGKIDQSLHEEEMEIWKNTRKEIQTVSESDYQSNRYIQMQMGVKDHIHDTEYPWLFFIKENPHTIKINFYPRKKEDNGLLIDTFCKPSLRYRLSGDK